MLSPEIMAELDAQAKEEDAREAEMQERAAKLHDTPGYREMFKSNDGQTDA